ncbi:MAG: D-aminoacyl-tRNA deacylase [Acidaminobacteraceae bacterium]
MRAVVQRVSRSSVSVDDEIIASVEKGIMVLLGVESGDTEKDVDYMVEKIINLRIFEDDDEVMNYSLLDIKGEMLAISQFTLLGDCRKGRRPSYKNAEKPDQANTLYESFVEKSRLKDVRVKTGKFQAEMIVDIVNDGPVTLLIDSNKTF